MGDKFDDIAKEIAKGMPRRRVLKLLAGGLAAVVGSRVANLPAAAYGDKGLIGINQTLPRIPGINQAFPHGFPRINQTIPHHPGVNQTIPHHPGINQTIPRHPGVNQTFPHFPGVNQTIPPWRHGW